MDKAKQCLSMSQSINFIAKEDNSNDNMKNLVPYKLFEDSQELTPKQIGWLNLCSKGTWELNPQTGLVDIKGNFVSKGPDFLGIKFGKAEGNFICRDNNLTSLEGAPQEVGGIFDCSNNNLTSLKGAPQVVKGDFDCSVNNLTSLEGAPQVVKGDFYCSVNSLTSLKWAPQVVKGGFYCSNNNLTSLKGAPQKVGGDFYCRNNNLTSLEGAPQKVVRNFFCSDNNLTSLEGAPQEVGGDLDFSSNPVSKETLEKIIREMLKGKEYEVALREIWNEISIEDTPLLYRPHFNWLSPEEHKKIKALSFYSKTKNYF